MPQDLVLRGPEGEVVVGDGHKTLIIAEIGQNHQGDINLAKNLILAAKHAGADCVKFQKTHLTARFTNAALARPYAGANSFGATYGEHRQRLELTDEEFAILQEYAGSLNMLFTASAMDAASLSKMAAMDVPFIKIGSGDANNFPLLAKAARLNLPLIVSTGMQRMHTIERIYNTIAAHHQNFVLMHCVSSYPTRTADANLNLIHVYRRKFPNVHIGYSGHEVGSIAHLAVAAGAKVVERHFTLDKTLKGSDHACSLDPMDFAAMVTAVRSVEVAMGSCEKQILKCEEPCRAKLGKSLVAAKSLKSGDIIGEEEVAVKVSHPPGIPAERIDDVIGLQLTSDLDYDEIYELKLLKKPLEAQTLRK